MKTLILAAAISGAFFTAHAPAQAPRDGASAPSSENLSDLGARLKAVHEYRDSVRSRFGGDRDGYLTDRGAAAYKDAVKNGSFPAPPEGPALSPGLAKKYANSDGSLSADGRLAMTIDALTDRLSQNSEHEGERPNRGPGPDDGRPQRRGFFGGGSGGVGPSESPTDLGSGPPRGRDDFGAYGNGGFGRGESRPMPRGRGSEETRRPSGDDREARESEPSHREDFSGSRFGPPRGGNEFAGRGFGGREFRPQRPGPGAPGAQRPPVEDRDSRWSERSHREDFSGPQRLGPPQEFAERPQAPWGENRNGPNDSRPDFRNRLAERGQDFRNWSFGRPEGFAQRSPFSWFNRPFDRNGFGGARSFGGGFAQRDQGFHGRRFGGPEALAQRSTPPWFRSPNERDQRAGRRSFGEEFAGRRPGIRGPQFGSREEFAQRPPQSREARPDARGPRGFERDFRESPPERSRYRDEYFHPRSDFGARPWRDGSDFRRPSERPDMTPGPAQREPSDRDGQPDERPRRPGFQRE